MMLAILFIALPCVWLWFHLINRGFAVLVDGINPRVRGMTDGERNEFFGAVNGVILLLSAPLGLVSMMGILWAWRVLQEKRNPAMMRSRT